MKKAIIPMGIIVLMIFGVFMYINRFTEFHTVEVQGRVFSSDDITSNLTTGVTKDSKKIKYENIKVNDTIYKSGKKYYIGEENKKNVVIDYPIITEDESSLLILSDSGNFVDEKYNKSTTYKNTYISEGILYNGQNYSKADDAKYIFVEVGNGIYVNLDDVKVVTSHGEYDIPKFSFIYFESSFMRYYYESNGNYRFKEIAAIMDYDKITVDSKERDYYDFLILLGVLEPKTDKYEPEEEPVEEEEEPDQTIGSTEDADSIQLPPPDNTGGGANIVDKAYVKPEVKVSGIKAGVYSMKAHLEVFDPADRIYKAPTFEFYIGEDLYMRIAYSRTADIVIGGLLPNCTYKVVGVYNYRDERDQKRGGTFYEGEFTTRPTSELEDLNLSYGKVETGIKKVKVNDVKFTNKAGSEALYGIKTGYLNLSDGTNIKLSFTNVTDLSNLKTTIIESGNILNSGTEYTGQFIFYDIAGTKMNIKNNTVKFKTLKSPPIAELDVRKMNRNFTTVYTETMLKNPDKVTANNYRLVLFETESKRQVATRNLQSPEENINYQESSFDGLKPETYYTAAVYCDYINDDGEWVYGYEITSEKVYTADLSSLGAVKTAISVSDIEPNSAIVDIKFTEFDAGESVYILMEEIVPIKITSYDEDGETVLQEIVIEDYTKNQIASGVTINIKEIEELYSNTEYTITVNPYILLDEGVYNISTTPPNKTFKTLKLIPTIYAVNGYIAQGYADYDICIEDIDGAILTNEATVEFVDEDGIGAGAFPVPTKPSCTTNADGEEDVTFGAFTRVTNEKLNPAKKYKLAVKYQEYQLNVDEKAQKHTEYPLGENPNIIPDGTSADFEMTGLTNDVNYDLRRPENVENLENVNLFDLTNNSRWIYKGYVSKEMSLETRIDAKEFEISSSAGYKAFSYYIPELKGTEYTISFEYDFKTAAASASKGAAYLMFTEDAVNISEVAAANLPSGTSVVNNTQLIAANTNATGVKKGFSVHSFTAGNSLAQTGGYITFYLKVPNGAGEKTSLTIRKLKIDIGYTDVSNTANLPAYTEFGTATSGVEHTNTYTGEFLVNFDDLMTETLKNTHFYPDLFFNSNWTYEYYMKFYNNGEEIESTETSNLAEVGATRVENYEVAKRYLQANSKLEARIGVKVHYSENYTKDHDLMSMEFTTETETRTLTTLNELKTMHPYGYYIMDLEGKTCSGNPDAGKCIDLTSLKYAQTFQGSIDFQGQAAYIKGYNAASDSNYLHQEFFAFESLGGGGVIKNLNLYVDFTEDNSVQKPLWYMPTLVGINNGLISNIQVTYIGDIQPRSMVIGESDYFTCEKTDAEGNKYMDDHCTRLEPKYFRDTGLEEYSLITATNNGTVENFHIKLDKQLPVLKYFGLVALNNNGTIKNGYVTGENIKAGFYNSNTQKEIGIIASKSNANSKISNIYSLIDITTIQDQYADSFTLPYVDGGTYLLTQDPLEQTGGSHNLSSNPNDRIAGNIAAIANNAIIENVLTVDTRYVRVGDDYKYTTNGRLPNVDPMIPTGANNNTKNLYFITKETSTITTTVSEETSTGALTAPGFMENAINGDQMFNVVQASSINSFPRLLWPDIMPSQTMLGFPKVDADSLKFLSIKEVKQSDDLTQDEKDRGYVARIIFELFNPDNHKIQELEFDGLKDIVLPTKQGDINADGIQELEIYVKNITKYQVDYKISKIAIKDGDSQLSCEANNLVAFDCSTINTKTYPIDIYMYVYDINDLKDAISDGNNNLRLGANITTKIDTDYFLQNSADGSFNGVLDGNGKYITEIESDNCFIKKLNKGTIKNLSIKKYTVNYSNGTYGAYAGLVCQASNGANIDNVHIGEVFNTDVDEYGQPRTRSYTLIAEGAETYIGGLVGYSSNAIITNSSVSDMALPATLPSQLDSGDLYIGGLVGYMENTEITNSFVRNLNLALTNYIPDTQQGFTKLNAAGGIVGQIKSGTVENAYATGVIDAKVQGTGSAGGIVGVLAPEYDSEGNILGNINVKSVISKVNVYTNGDEIGGVIGKTEEASSFASQTLALADVMTSKETYTNLDRTSGTRITRNKNFAWNKQLINSKVDANTNLEELLNEEELRTTSVYQTKIGLNTSDFALDIDAVSDADDYYLMVKYDHQTDTGLKTVIKQSDIRTVVDEDGRTFEVFDMVIDGTSQTLEIKGKYGTIPKIRHSSTGKILNNQDYTTAYKDVSLEYVEKFNIITEPKYEYKQVDRINQTIKENVKPWEADYVSLSFELQIQEPDIKIDTLYFDITDMHYFGTVAGETNQYGNAVPDTLKRPQLALKEGTQDTYIVTSDVVANVNKNYDSYNIEEFRYYNYSNLTKEEKYPTKIKMIIPFYGKIDSVQDWQDILPGTLQNFSLAADLDFSGIANVNAELSFNKLLGLPNPLTSKNYVIKNITIDNGKRSLIKNVASELRSIDFDNVTIETTTTSNRVGLLETMSGQLYGYDDVDSTSYDMGFRNIYIHAPNASYVGIIASNNASSINKVDMENIYVRGKQYVGGLTGYSPKKVKTNITARNIIVIGTSSYVGGLVGKEDIDDSRVYITNATIDGLYVKGSSSYVGGAVGWGTGENITVTGSNATIDISKLPDGHGLAAGKKYNYVHGASSYAGGAFGYTAGNNKIKYLTTQNLTIEGRGTYTGGVVGYGGYLYYLHSINNTVDGRSRTGGTAGYGSNKYHLYTLGNTITGTTAVGGLVGYSGWCYVSDGQVGPYRDAAGGIKHTTVSGDYYVGGIVGQNTRYAYIYKNIVQATISGKHTVGGLLGFVDMAQTQTTPDPMYLKNNIIANSTIIATEGLTTSSINTEGVNTTNSATATIDYTNKKYYFLGGLVGRFYRNFRSNNTIEGNTISAKIEVTSAADANAYQHELRGVGYVYGGSTYAYKINSPKKVEVCDEETGECTQTTVNNYILYDWTTVNGDEHIYFEKDGKVESSTQNTKLYEGSTINGLSYDTLSKTAILSEYFQKYYSKPLSSGKLKILTETNLKTYSSTAYNTSAFGKSGRDSVDSSTISYFPYPKVDNYREVAEIEIAYNLPRQVSGRVPTSPTMASSTQTSITTSTGFHLLPDFEVYASDVDKINIEFKKIDPKSTFVLNETEYSVSQTIYTFYYDFKEDFDIVIKDGINEKTISIKADDVKNGVAVIGDYYYKLDDEEVITNQPKDEFKNESSSESASQEETVEEQETESGDIEESISSDEVLQEEEYNVSLPENAMVAQIPSSSKLLKKLSAKNKLESVENESQTIVENATNIYGDKILLNDKSIYDISTGTVNTNSFENLTIVENKPLFETEYNGQKIQTYLNYSLIDGVRINKQVFVQNGQIEILDTALDNNKSKTFIQTHNDLSFVVYLGKDGKLHSLKDEIVYPKEFKNIKIKNINSNFNTNTDNLLVEYEDGSYIAFNYRTGEVISEYKNKNVDLIDYVKDYLAISSDNVKKLSTNKSYDEAKKLVNKLNKKSIEQVLRSKDENNDSPELYSRKYSISYNSNTGEYEVFEVPVKSQKDKSDLLKSLSTSVNDIIDSNPVLVKYYKGQSGTRISTLSSIMITLGVILGIISATILIGRYYKKVRKARS